MGSRERDTEPWMGSQNRALESHRPSIDGAEAICYVGVVRASKKWKILDESLGR